MSDNPADSPLPLLKDRIHGAIHGSCVPDHEFEYCMDILDTVWPLVSAGLEAARADERERINQPRDRAMRAARELASLTAEEWRVLEAFEPTKVNELRALLAHPPARGGV